MDATFRVWDDETGNVIASFGTQAEAVGFLREMFEENGAEGVRDLAIIAYSLDDGKPSTIVEGAAFAEECLANA